MPDIERTVFWRMGYAVAREGASRDDAIEKAGSYAAGRWGRYDGDLTPDEAEAEASEGWGKAERDRHWRNKRHVNRLVWVVDGAPPVVDGDVPGEQWMAGYDACTWALVIFRTRAAPKLLSQAARAREGTTLVRVRPADVLDTVPRRAAWDEAWRSAPLLYAGEHETARRLPP